MKEIEIKILEINPKDIEKKVLSLGGKKTGSHLIKERFYDYPDGRLKSKFSILRIRSYGKITELTFKHSTKKLDKSPLAIREELQVEVNDAKELEKIVFGLGLVLTRDREKKRTSFVLETKDSKSKKVGEVKIEIDVYPGVPPYMEVEGDAKSIPLAVKRFGFEMKDTTNISSTKVLKKYGKSIEFLKF